MQNSSNEYSATNSDRRLSTNSFDSINHARQSAPHLKQKNQINSSSQITIINQLHEINELATKEVEHLKEHNEFLSEQIVRLKKKSHSYKHKYYQMCKQVQFLKLQATARNEQLEQIKGVLSKHVIALEEYSAQNLKEQDSYPDLQSSDQLHSGTEYYQE